MSVARRAVCASPLSFVTINTGRNSRPARPFASASRSGVRAYSTPQNGSHGHGHGHGPGPTPGGVGKRPAASAQQQAQHAPPAIPHSPPLTPPQARHEAHEGTSAINIPYNPPGGGPGAGPGGGGRGGFTQSPSLDALLTTAVGLSAVFLGGIVYVKWYKYNVLRKIEMAFQAGYDPALELAKSHTIRPATGTDLDEEFGMEDEPWTQSLRRKEQDIIDRVVFGEEAGHYYMLLGPKGSGKGTMIFEAMGKCQADGVSVCDAHPDLEVFRLRLGKALNYEFNEDTQTGLFQRRDPREGGPALDIERALNKLEKVALSAAKKRGKPYVLIINNVHFFQNDEEGRNMILQLQQKAEAWAASGVLTLVFSSDDVWPYHVMRKYASRMHVLSISDLNGKEPLQAALRIRRDVGRPANFEEIKKAVEIVGGRLSYLNKVAKSKDIIGMAKHLLETEKAWLLSQIGLIPDCDDDVMDEQKWSSCSWLLLQEFAKMRQEQIAELKEKGEEDRVSELPLPVIPYWKCRVLMTRADFMEELDRLNIISIDINHDVRPDSTLILHAAMEVASEDGYDELLEGVRDRIDEIESLHRTRELTFKDLDKGDMVRLMVDKRGGALERTLRDDEDGNDDDDDD